MRQTKPSEATGGIFSKISNKTDWELYQTIFDSEVSTKEEIQKEMLESGYHTSDLTRSLQRLQSAGMIVFDEGYSTTDIGTDTALYSLNSKNGHERYMAVDTLAYALEDEMIRKEQEGEAIDPIVFDTVVNSLINRMNNDNNMDVILRAGTFLFAHFIVGVELWTVEGNSSEQVQESYTVPAISPWMDRPLAPIDEVYAGSDMAKTYRGKIIKALSDVSRKAMDIAIKCGAAKVTAGNDNWWVSNLSVKWEKAQDDTPKIDVSKCPWKVNLAPGHKDWEKPKCADMLKMIVDWRDD
jgi:hypothetical protein